MTSKMTVDGRVTLPQQAKDALKLQPGDPVEFAVNTKGQIVLRHAAPRMTVAQVLEEMDKAVRAPDWTP